MIKKTFTYTDFNGVERTDECWFHLSKAEIMEMEMSTVGGLTTMINKIVATQDAPSMFRIVKELVLKAYGEKSADGRRFVKSPELSEAFSQTEAYSQLIMEFMTDAEAAAKFINGIVPADVAKEAAKVSNQNAMFSATN